MRSLSPLVDPTLYQQKWQTLSQTLPAATPRLSPPVQLPHTNWTAARFTTGVPTTPPTTDVRSPRLSALSALQAVRSAFDLHLRLGSACEAQTYTGGEGRPVRPNPKSAVRVN